MAPRPAGSGYRRYGWSKPAGDPLQVALKPHIDPEHLTPDPVDLSPQLWQSNAIAPTMPEYMMDGDGTGAVIVGGGGPLDHTPADRSRGYGPNPALTTLEAQDLRGTLHSEDLGAYAAHVWQPTTDRDQTGPHVDIVYDTPGEGDSPQTLQLQRTGVGQPNDPYARTGRRIVRWWDRTIDMHWWAPEMRPMRTRNAYNAPAQPAVPDGGQLDSPFATAVTAFLGSPDSFVAPQERRTPGAWDTEMTVDGTSSTSPYGLSAWGL